MNKIYFIPFEMILMTQSIYDVIVFREYENTFNQKIDYFFDDNFFLNKRNSIFGKLAFFQKLFMFYLKYFPGIIILYK